MIVQPSSCCFKGVKTTSHMWFFSPARLTTSWSSSALPEATRRVWGVVKVQKRNVKCALVEVSWRPFCHREFGANGVWCPKTVRDGVQNSLPDPLENLFVITAQAQKKVLSYCRSSWWIQVAKSGQFAPWFFSRGRTCLYPRECNPHPVTST